MGVKFNVQIEIPEQLVDKLSTYSFINRDDWMLYANSSKILPEKYTKVINALFTRKLKSLAPNNTYDLVKELPERARKMLVGQLGVDMKQMRGLTAYEMIAKIEKDRDAVVVFADYGGTIQAHLLPRKP